MMKHLPRLLAPAALIVAGVCYGAQISAMPSAVALRPVARAAHSAPFTLPPRFPSNVSQSCAGALKFGEAHCLALVRTDVGDAIWGHVRNSTPIVSGYWPADLHSAYNIPNVGGSGQTVGIVDAFDDPNAEIDLRMYRKQFGLPACTSSNGCFLKVNQRGIRGSYPAPDAGWATEISLDLDMVSATCPACKIILVESDNNYFNNLGPSVDTAVALGANVVSNSYSGAEFSYTNKYYAHPGHVIVAASDDTGIGAAQPCAYASVVCVGGTSLLKRRDGTRDWSEWGWNYAGSGCSFAVAKPAWQHDLGCQNRTETDVSAVADPWTGVAIYNSYTVCCWFVYGGTSVATPIIASLYALAGNASSQQAAKNIWDDKGAHLFDVTKGPPNGQCQQKYLCKPGPGYDGPTGWGTPNGLAEF